MDNLKRYEAERSKLESKKLKIETEIKGFQISLTSINTRLSNVKKKIESIRLKNRGTQITDHARIRYMERVLGINIKDLDTWIMEEKDHKNVKKGNIITTIYTKND